VLGVWGKSGHSWMEVLSTPPSAFVYNAAYLLLYGVLFSYQAVWLHPISPKLCCCGEIVFFDWSVLPSECLEGIVQAHL